MVQLYEVQNTSSLSLEVDNNVEPDFFNHSLRKCLEQKEIL